MASYEPVTAVLRALEVLLAVNRLKEASLGDIHRETGLNRPTTVRMLETLIHAGFVCRRPTQAIYLPTGRTLDLSSGYQKHEEMALAAAPTLTRQPDALRRLLETIRHNGYAAMNKDYSNRSYNGTASAIGVPILLDGHAVGGLNLMFLRNTPDEAGVIDRFIAPLQQASAVIAAALAGLRSGVVQP